MKFTAAFLGIWQDMSTLAMKGKDRVAVFIMPYVGGQTMKHRSAYSHNPSLDNFGNILEIGCNKGKATFKWGLMI